MGEGRSRERVWERIGRVWTCGKRKCMKNQPQKQQSWHFRVCLYLEPFKSRASNLTILQKSPQKFNVFAIVADASGRLPPHRLWRSDDSPSVIPNWEWTSLTLMNVIVTYLLYCTAVWFCILVNFRYVHRKHVENVVETGNIYRML